ncbi:unnamed protein product [Hermetia illucens]|uniref:Galectin n=1 Tax=Hermetia illucens TaxID=343691 RepID=A0A7R8UXY1_HERIL|nr:galectin-4-like isoform X1 [Hermetia illucens]CAD7088619.1 unnamed protein product [Hermetia illucens]
MCSCFGQNLDVPFTSQIPGGLFPGTRIWIRGAMHHCAKKFTIDFQCGPVAEKDDSAFHISMRPGEGVVRNTFQNYEWGPEERTSSFPFVPGQPYDIEIEVHNEKFSVRINGEHFFDYIHRIPLDMISYILIVGDTTLHYVGY